MWGGGIGGLVGRLGSGLIGAERSGRRVGSGRVSRSVGAGRGGPSVRQSVEDILSVGSGQSTGLGVSVTVLDYYTAPIFLSAMSDRRSDTFMFAPLFFDFVLGGGNICPPHPPALFLGFLERGRVGKEGGGRS